MSSDLTAITQTRLQGRLQRWLPPLAAAVLLCTALWVLHTTLQGIHYHELHEAFAAMSADHLAWAMLFCLANYLVLTTYDQLAFVYIGKRIARAYIALTAFIGYAISNSVGFALLSGTAVRHHFYSRRGVASADLSRIVAFNAITYWLGLLALTGYSRLMHHETYLPGVLAHWSMQWLGAVCLAVAADYVLLPLLRKTPLRVRGFDMRVPPLPLTIGQLAVPVTDWALAAAVLYVVLPQNAPPYPVLLAAFLMAQLLGVASQCPVAWACSMASCCCAWRPTCRPARSSPPCCCIAWSTTSFPWRWRWCSWSVSKRAIGRGSRTTAAAGPVAGWPFGAACTQDTVRIHLHGGIGVVDLGGHPHLPG